MERRSLVANPKFEFEIGKKVLALECSHFGKEIVTLNGELVSESRTLKFRNKHFVKIDDRTFTIELHANNIFTGRLTCNLYASDELQSSKFTKAELGEKNKIVSIVLLLLFCGLLGMAIPKMGSWVWLSPLLFVLSVIVAMAGRERIYNVQTKNT